MDFRFSEEQLELQAMARSFLEEASGPEQIRAAMETPLGYDQKVWEQIATELGWACVHIPEEYGGLGLGTVDLVVARSLAISKLRGKLNFRKPGRTKNS